MPSLYFHLPRKYGVGCGKILALLLRTDPETLTLETAWILGRWQEAVNTIMNK